MLFFTISSLSDITASKYTSPCLRLFIQQSFKAFGIMHFCRRGIIRKYDLIAFLNFSMPLVAVKSLITLLCPAGIYILVALLVGIVIPQLITRSLFYLLNPLAELSQCILDSSNGSIINVI